jgi:hypothetical protein
MPDGGSFAVAAPVTNLWQSPDAVRDIDAPMVADPPDPAEWTAGLGITERRQLQNRVLTQLLLGEPVDVVEDAGEWVRIVAPWQPSERHPLGYPGWVPRSHLGASPPPAAREAVVTAAMAALTNDDGATLCILSYATILPVSGESPGPNVPVTLPGGKHGWLDRSVCIVRDVPEFRDPALVDAGDAVAEAQRFGGLAYLWAGTSAYGLDCSGLVHITYRRLGAVIPRDAHDQAEACRDVPRDRTRPGDLLFFARPGKGIHHVGFALSDPEHILHAPQTGRTIVAEPLNADRRATVLDTAGRFLLR